MNKYNTFIGLLHYFVCQLLHMKNCRHDSKTQCTTRTSLWPSPGPYITVSWAVPGLALAAAAAAGISQDDSAALQYIILTDKEQWRQFICNWQWIKFRSVNRISVLRSKIFVNFTSNYVLDIFKSNKLSNKNSDNCMSPMYTERGKELRLPPVRVYRNNIFLCTFCSAYFFLLWLYHLLQALRMSLAEPVVPFWVSLFMRICWRLIKSY